MSGAPSGKRRNPWQLLLVAGCAVFIFTVFLMVAAALNLQAAAMARFFDAHGMTVLGAEVGFILVSAVIVMSFERRETLRRLEEREASLLNGAGGLDPGRLAGRGESRDANFPSEQTPTTPSDGCA